MSDLLAIKIRLYPNKMQQKQLNLQETGVEVDEARISQINRSD